MALLNKPGLSSHLHHICSFQNSAATNFVPGQIEQFAMISDLKEVNGLLLLWKVHFFKSTSAVEIVVYIMAVEANSYVWQVDRVA